MSCLVTGGAPPARPVDCREAPARTPRGGIEKGASLTAEKIELFLHIAGAFMIVGGTIALSLLYAAMRRTKDPAQLELLLRLAGRTSMITLPGALLAIITGSLLAATQGLNFGAQWISSSYTLWFISVAVSAAVLGPALSAARTLAASELAAGKRESQAVADAVGATKIRLVVRFLEISLLLFLYLMVFKPGA